MNNKLIIFSIPEDVTKDQIVEAFKDFGEIRFEYKKKSWTGNEKGGHAIIKPRDINMVSKVMQSLDSKQTKNMKIGDYYLPVK